MFFVLVSLTGFAQTIGDYRSVGTGEWTNVNSWQTWNGSNWILATSYPGQNAGTYAVAIQAGSSIIVQSSLITNAMGTVTINGALNILANQTFTLSTMLLSVTKNLNPPATINFGNKAVLQLPDNAEIVVGQGALSGSCSNNNEIRIGAITYSYCEGGGADHVTFEDLMDQGGTFKAVASASTPVCKGTNVKLFGGFIGAVGTAPTYSWVCSSKPSGSAYTFSSNTTQNPYTGNLPDIGSYTFKLTVSTIISSISISKSITITIVVEDSPSITTHPISQTICLGGSVTFNVISPNIPAPTFQWRKGITNIAEATSSSFTILSVSSSDVSSSDVSDWYNVLVTNSCSSITSNNAKLSIYPTLVSGAHNTDPVTACVNYNPEVLSFTTAISGGKLPYSYQWQLNGSPITGATLATYDSSNLTATGSYKYNCIVTDACGSSFTTTQKQITINADPTVSITGNASTCRNVSSTLTAVVVGGTGSSIYQWQASPDGLASYTDIAGATSATYTPPTTISGDYYYQIQITGGAACSQPKATIKFTVNPLPTPTPIYHN